MKRRSFTKHLTLLFFSLTGSFAVMAEQGIFPPMEDNRFWELINLIEGSKIHDDTTNLTPLEMALTTHSANDIGGFFETLAQKLYALDTRAHYRSFSWFKGSSDIFLYTRLGVIAQGEHAYTKILNNSKDFPSKSTNWLEGLLYVAPNAYEKVTGEELDRITSVDFESFSNVEGWKK